jgi:F-type H+-transporting ATPase subunit a
VTPVLAAAPFHAASGGIEVGVHWDPFGIGLNVDTLIYTLIAGAVVIALGLYVRAKVTSGVPGKVQLFLETINGLVRKQVEESVGLRVAPFAVPLGITLFFFLLVANWISLFSFNGVPEPPTSDVNLPYALTVFVLIWVHVFGIRKNGLHYFEHYTKPFAVMLPMEILTQLARFLSLPLRLFGNMFAGTIMLQLIVNLMPVYVSWVPGAAWKLFDLFVGAMQAFIFTLLTIVYFGEFAPESHGEATTH